jgi:hypothetical protein
MLKNRSNFVGPAAFIAGLVLASFSFSAAAPKDDAAPKQETIDVLLKQRVEILKSRHDQAFNAYENGVFDFDKVHVAQVHYLNARLDVCADNAERIAVLKESVDEAKWYHKAAVERFAANIGDKVEVLAAKAYVLEARIALARAQQAK